MLNRLRFWNTLKMRLFASFVALLLLPLCLAVFLLFQHFDSIRQQDMMERMSDGMSQVSSSLKDMMGFAYKTHIMLNQDESLLKILANPDEYEPIERKRVLESKMAGINNSFFFHQADLYFKLIDKEGNVYTSYAPVHRLENSSDELGKWHEKLAESPYAYQWVLDDVNDLYNAREGRLLSLYILLDDPARPQKGGFGLARISINVQEWLNIMLKNSFTRQDMAIVSGSGEIIAQNRNQSQDWGGLLQKAGARPALAQGYFRDEHPDRLVNYNYLPDFDWYVINQVPLDQLMRELERLRLLFFIGLGGLVAVFIGVTLYLSSKITKPLHLLERRMEEATDRGLNIRMPIDPGAPREVVSLGKSFNRMIDNILELIERLHLEERQRQAVRFQMLLAQMNPHFLLNTLNTVKWMARKEKQESIAGICASLGVILEAGLNHEIELIPLKQEIQLLQSYVSVQEFRYRDLFTVHYELDGTVDYALVPKLSLQPLVENAIVHGLDSSHGEGRIWIRANREDKRLMLEVEDNGIGMEQAALKSAGRKRRRKGIGLSNLKERLQLLFKEQAELITASGQTGTRIALSLPLLIATPYAQEGEDGHVDRFSGGG